MKKLITATLIIAATASSALSAEKVVATVNGKKITEKELNETIKNLPPSYNNLKKNPEFRKMVLENMVREELLYQEAIKEGLENNPKVKEEIEKAKRRILIQALLRKHIKLPPIKVSEQEARAFYEKNKRMFLDPNGKPVPFESLKPFIIQSLKRKKEQQAFQEAVERYIKELEKKEKVEIKGVK
ncbi:SurA N-terminal domain-containing protein [Thermovibrio sp.]